MFILGLNDVDVLFMMMMLMMLFIVQMFIVQIQMMFILGLCRGILSSKFRKKNLQVLFFTYSNWWVSGSFSGSQWLHNF